MTYYNGNPRTGKPPITRVLCDKCGEEKVPFEILPDKTKMQKKPWRWSPIFGTKCDRCKVDC